jgi:hypothetical protein
MIGLNGNMLIDDSQPASTRLKVAVAVSLLILMAALSAYVTGWRKLPQCCGLVAFVSFPIVRAMSKWRLSAEPLTRRDEFWFRAIEYATVPFFLVYIAGFFRLIE